MIDKLRTRLLAHWQEIAVGGVTGGFVAWIVMVVGQASRKGFDLIVNSDVIGAAIGAFLAIAGAYGLENWRRMSTVKTAENVARKTAVDLLKSLNEYQQYMIAYYYSDENGRDSEGKTVSRGNAPDRALTILQSLERAAITLDAAANLALIGSPSAMIPIAHLRRSIEASTDGLLEITKKAIGDNSKNDEVVSLFRRGLMVRARLSADLYEYINHSKLWNPSQEF